MTPQPTPSTAIAQPQPKSMGRLAVVWLATFVAINVSATMIAMAMNPLIQPTLGTFIRNPERDGLFFPALLGGYAVITAMVAFMHTRGSRRSAAQSAAMGMALGLAIFFGGHLVVAGWSTLPAAPMALSGLLDAIAVCIGSVVFSLVSSRRSSNGESPLEHGHASL